MPIKERTYSPPIIIRQMSEAAVTRAIRDYNGVYLDRMLPEGETDVTPLIGIDGLTPGW